MKTCVNTKRTALDEILGNFIVVVVDKVMKNAAVICNHFHAFVITKELSLGNNDEKNTYKEISDLSYNGIVVKNINDSSSKFGIKNVLYKIIGYLRCIGCLKCIKSHQIHIYHILY